MSGRVIRISELAQIRDEDPEETLEWIEDMGIPTIPMEDGSVGVLLADVLAQSTELNGDQCE